MRTLPKAQAGYRFATPEEWAHRFYGKPGVGDTAPCGFVFKGAIRPMHRKARKCPDCVRSLGR